VLKILFIIPALLLFISASIYSVTQFVFFLKTRKSKHLIRGLKPWIYFGLFVLAIITLHWYFSLVQVHKQDIIGKYEVDTAFYPGINAE
jgi:hypothetical protein